MNPIFLMLVGLPSSGKSTFAKLNRKTFKVHSSDAIREELLDDVNSQENNELVFQTLHDRVKEDLKKGNNVIYDATNISYKRRMNVLKLINDIPCDKSAYVFMTAIEDCIERNLNRERVVPLDVINKMYLNFDIPAYFEGWDFINVLYNGSTKYQESNLLNIMLNFNQENSHHSFSLGEHCLEAFKYVHTQLDLLGEVKDGDNISIAAYYHDIGKLKTKRFIDSKGLPCKDAHYYNHERVSSYDFMLYAEDHYMGDLGIREDILDIAQLIRWHMLYYNPDVTNNPKTKAKFTNLFGQEFLNRLYILHLADKKAH